MGKLDMFGRLLGIEIQIKAGAVYTERTAQVTKHNAAVHRKKTGDRGVPFPPCSPVLADNTLS